MFSWIIKKTKQKYITFNKYFTIEVLYDSDMVACTVILSEIMGVILPLANALQERGGDVIKAVESVKAVIQVIQEYRTTTMYDEIWAKVSSFNNAVQINVTSKKLQFLAL